jgi:hypothetical protein
MGALFAMSAFLLSRKQIVVAPANESLAPASSPVRRAKVKTPPVTDLPPVAPPAGSPEVESASSVAAVNEQVNSSLDALKDSIFRLELRHQAGTISEQEYAKERTRMEQLIRDLVRG